ncbi:hypothetical protein QJQ45_002771 [Haematococcus lacustris]|nr:hypothetical protein QJQ45_002771 [Haematococcus lacustris]
MRLRGSVRVRCLRDKGHPRWQKHQPSAGTRTRKCNFKESEAAKEMAKTDDNVKEFLEKCVKRHKPASTSEPSCSQPAASAEQGGKQADIESLLGKWMYATGSSFRSVEVPEFKDLIHAACHCTLCYLVIAPCAGTDRAAGDARFNLHQRWLMPKALQLVGLNNSILDTVLTANPCMWWQTYGHGFGVLRDVAMRLLSIPATSASTERVFSTFKHIWSDHRQSMGRMWMSSYIYFNRRALKGTRGQTRSSEEERAEFEEWLQHQPNGISK